jgi:hypothetical protein
MMMPPRSPFRHSPPKTYRQVMHFMWHYFPEYRDSTMDRFTIIRDRVFLCAELKARMKGDETKIEVARVDGYTEMGTPRFCWVEEYAPAEGLWLRAVDDLEPWGPIEQVWKVPSQVFTHACDEHHPLSPRDILFHARSACLHAIQEWIEEVVGVEDRDSLGYRTYHPLSFDAERKLVGGYGETAYEWRHEDVTIRTTEEGVFTGSRSWFRPMTKQRVPVFDAAGAPAGIVEKKVPVCDWIPYMKMSAGKMPEDLTVKPDFVENPPISPEEETLYWGDMVG